MMLIGVLLLAAAAWGVLYNQVLGEEPRERPVSIAK
jgi:hypothetical protein